MEDGGRQARYFLICFCMEEGGPSSNLCSLYYEIQTDFYEKQNIYFMYGCNGEKGRERRVQRKREKGEMERKFFSFYVFG